MKKRDTSRWAILVLAAVPAIAGCSQAFWDRSPTPQGRVQGIYVRGPLADVQDLSRGGLQAPTLVGDPDGSPAASSGAAEVPMPSQHDFAALAEVNRVRAQHGVPAVRFEAKLFAAAWLHSQEQMRGGYLGHESRDASRATLGQRMQMQSYTGRTYAEVVAKDFPDARSVVAAWMDSPRHREVLLDPDLVEAAFARFDGPANRTNRWTGDFADPGRSYTPLPTPPAGVPTAAVGPASVPNPALRTGVAPSGSARSAVAAPARPAIPSPVAAQPVMPPPQAPARVAVQAPMPSPVVSAPRTYTPPLVGSPDGNVVPPASGARVVAPAAPYYVQPSAPRVTTQQPSVPSVVTQQPRYAQPSAPYTAASAPRASVPTSVPYQPPPRSVQPRRKVCVGGT